MPHFNPAVADLATPPIPAVQGWARAYGGAYGPLVDLSQAVPGYPPHPDLLRWLAEAAGSPAYAGYGAIEGEADLRVALAVHSSALYGADITQDRIHITAGCNQAFVVTVMALAAAGDAVLLLNPFYFNHDTSLAMLGIGTEVVDARAQDGFVPDPDAIARAIHGRVRAVALITPNNPTGAVYPPAILEAVYEICRERGVWLLLDETYRDFLAAQGPPHRLYARPDWQDTLIGLYSFSKSHCIPGHRLGAITASPEVVAQVAKVMDNLQICAPRAPQAAVARALPALAGWREDNRREIARRAAAFSAAMAQAPDWHVASCGAYFAYLRHPFEHLTAAEVAERLGREFGVLCLPGEYFGAGQRRFLRMAFANAGSDTIGLLPARLRALEVAAER